MLGGPSPRARPWIVIATLAVIGWFSVAFRHALNPLLPAELGLLSIPFLVTALAVWVFAYREIRLVRRAETLVTSGIYAHTRNPVYLSAILGVFSGALYARRLLAFVWVLVSYLVLYWMARQEERELERAYGEPYARYKARVPLLMPRLWT